MARPALADTLDLTPHPEGGEPQALISSGVWQRTMPADTDALVSCVVSPGFDDADFEMLGS